MIRAIARVVAEPADAGATRLAVLRSEAPLLLRRTGPDEIHLVGGAAGPLGGDDLRLEIDVRPGARLCVRTVESTVALPGRGPSRFTVTASVADGAVLCWLPEPLVAAARCDHEVSSTVDLASTARLLWRDELVCGRHGEDPGDARLTTVVRRAGRPLYHHGLAVGPHAPGWDGPAVLGGHRAAGSLLAVNLSAAHAPLAAPDRAVFPLAGPAFLVTALGDARAVRNHLDAASHAWSSQQ